MTLIDQLAERHIQQAAQRGEFDDLPGAGKPLVLDDDALIPEELRAGYRLLKNAGYLPPELRLNKEIKEAEQMLACVRDGGERDKAERRLCWLRLRLGQSRGDGVDFDIERRYREKLLQKL
jgi:DnaJ homologue, subfamily C, member 28, conserved domain